MIDVGFLTAFGAGALSFLSPCVLPLVPPYLCYMAGISVDEFRGETAKINRMGLFFAASAFVLGFTTVFVLLGMSASVAGQYLRLYQRELAMLAGVIIIIMGLNFMGLLRIGLLAREARVQVQGKRANPATSYLMGLAFAFGWTPCIGPVLGPILTLAGGRSSVAEGGLLLAVYSLGLGVPFLIAALFSGSFMRFLARFKVHLGRVEKVIGLLLVLAGIAFLTGGMERFAFWLIETFPILATFG